ncbi:UNVERIFIED_CONTAM: hypothetical protein K2H54_065618, partial [Gekko kuhli]
ALQQKGRRLSTAESPEWEKFAFPAADGKRLLCLNWGGISEALAVEAPIPILHKNLR